MYVSTYIRNCHCQVCSTKFAVQAFRQDLDGNNFATSVGGDWSLVKVSTDWLSTVIVPRHATQFHACFSGNRMVRIGYESVWSKPLHLHTSRRTWFLLRKVDNIQVPWERKHSPIRSFGRLRLFDYWLPPYAMPILTYFQRQNLAGIQNIDQN